jgi:hypothetical protein
MTSMAECYSEMLDFPADIMAKPEGGRPGGAGTFMQVLPIVTPRTSCRGIDAMPVYASCDDLHNPFLDVFTRHLQHITRPGKNVNRPVRIKIVTMGLRGLITDIEGFGKTYEDDGTLNSCCARSLTGILTKT